MVWLETFLRFLSIIIWPATVLILGVLIYKRLTSISISKSENKRGTTQIKADFDDEKDDKPAK